MQKLKKVKDVEKQEIEESLTFNVKDVARLCNISYSKARELINIETCPCLVVGRRILIPKEGFINWLNNRNYQS